MRYTSREHKRIANIIRAFQPYIDASRRIEVVFSRKLGYLLIRPNERSVQLIASAREMLNEMFWEQYTDALLKDFFVLPASLELLQEMCSRAKQYLERMGSERLKGYAQLEDFLTTFPAQGMIRAWEIKRKKMRGTV